MLDRLDRWADDPEVRVIGVTGIGGVGKTAVIGHWLKERGGDGRRESAGLFYWSFYAERSVGAFLGGLLHFAQEELGRPAPAEDVRPVDAARETLREVPLLLVLDGLEVLQERPGTSAYGELLEGDLRELLDAACRATHGLVILTSRFPFVDLSPYAGLGFRDLDVDRLTPDEGAALLERCEVGGSPDDRRDASRCLEGHPLALRVFAAALGTQADGDPTRLCEVIFEQANLSEDDPLERKLRHLLTFYEENLPPERTALLGIVSLFRTPVDETTIHRLAAGLSAMGDVFGDASPESIRAELDTLCSEHLLLRDREEGADLYSSHPVLRDHFRQALVSREASVAPEVAEAIAGPAEEGELDLAALFGVPSGERPKTIEELQPILAAIELLLDAGDFKRANELYQARVQLPGYNVFLSVPAPHEGVRCALGFVADEPRRTQCAEQLSERHLSYYRNEVGLYAQMAGEPQYAVRFFRDSAAVDRGAGDKRNLCIGLQNHADLLRHVGQLADSEPPAREALELAREAEEEPDQETLNSLCYLANALRLRGRGHKAMAAFDEANAIAKARKHWEGELASLAGTMWADLLLRDGQIPRARQLTGANLRICEERGWREDVARCHWILGRLDSAEGSLDAAAEHLDEAEGIMRRGHMLTELPWVLVAQADLRRRRQEWEEALRYAGEALRIAAPRELRLAHADALVMLGRIHLDRARAEGEPESEETRLQFCRAQDDGNAALNLARQCGYAWAERDAVELLADACQALGEKEPAVTHRREAETLSRQLQVDADE